MRWIWIDKFLEFRSGQFARAIKNLTLAEEHLHDHFPGYPVMPASLIIEGLAQTGGHPRRRGRRVRREGRPGQDPPRRVLRRGLCRRPAYLRSDAHRPAERGGGRRGQGVPEGELLADVEIVFAHLDNSRANQIFGPKNFVFTQQLLGVLDLAKAQARARELDGRGRRPAARSQWSGPRAGHAGLVNSALHRPADHGPRADRASSHSPGSSAWNRSERMSWSVGKNLSFASGLCPHDRRSRAIIRRRFDSGEHLRT